MMALDDLYTVIDKLEAAYASPYMSDYPLLVSQKKFKDLRWLVHCSQAYPQAPRKLKKCVVRKMERRRQREREKYL